MTLPDLAAPSKTTQFIQLQNPVRDSFAAFIFGNATHCDRVVEQDSAIGQTLVLCGAGPSLAEHAAKWCPRGDQVWGCNSAATYLHDRGHKVTHGLTVDQTPQMLTEWASAPPIEYLVASTIHPHLTEHLLKSERGLTWFHNYVGIDSRPVEYCACGHDRHDGPCVRCSCQAYDARVMDYEDWLYHTLYPGTVRAGSGLNAVTRAIDVALYMGFAKIIVLGADCALRARTPCPPGVQFGTPAHREWLERDVIMHADGGHALVSGATAQTLEGMIDGRYWVTKPDLMITAVWLVKWHRKLGSRLTLIGDTLPKALRDKPDEFLDRLPGLADKDGNLIKLI